VNGILCEVFFDFHHDRHAGLETPVFEGKRDRIVTIRALYRGHDMLGKYVDDRFDLLLICNKHDNFVDQAYAELIQHELRELGKHFLDDEGQDLTSHDVDDGEKNIVALVVESEALDVSLDRIEND
jgi:hypothetical protein